MMKSVWEHGLAESQNNNNKQRRTVREEEALELCSTNTWAISTDVGIKFLRDSELYSPGTRTRKLGG